MKRRRYMRKAICLLAGLAVAAMIPMSTRADDRQGRGDEETFTVDVALDGATLIVNHVDPTQTAEGAIPRRHPGHPGHDLSGWHST